MEKINFDMISLALKKLEKEIGVRLALDKNYITEINDYFLVGYNSAEFIETNNFSSRLVSNKPLIVNTSDVNVYLLIESDIDFENLSYSDIVNSNKVEKVL